MSTQLSEFTTFIAENDMDLDYLWFDLEPTNDACNAWNLGAAANTQLALQWVEAIKATSHRWGIYGNGYDELLATFTRFIGSASIDTTAETNGRRCSLHEIQMSDLHCPCGHASQTRLLACLVWKLSWVGGRLLLRSSTRSTR